MTQPPAYDDSKMGNVPVKAFSHTTGPFDPEDTWLRTANEEEKRTAMREWFYARYCDPAHDTPYNGREGGYLFVNGGPYDPADVMQDRFSGIVEDDLIDELVDEFVMEVGDEWAPIQSEAPNEFDYDERFDLQLNRRDEPLEQLNERLTEIEKILSLNGDSTAMALVRNLAFSAVVTALESFLWETVEYWVEHDETTLRNLVTKIPALRDQPMVLGDIFKQHEGLKRHVKGYLQNLVWHRWEKVVPLLDKGLGVKPPSFKPFEKVLDKRHDIVHRSGQSKDGVPVLVSNEEITGLCKSVTEFAIELNNQLKLRETLAHGADAPDF